MPEHFPERDEDLRDAFDEPESDRRWREHEQSVGY